MLPASCYAPTQERYFMSDEQKDAVIGRVVRERSDARKHLAALRTEANRLGQILSEIGRMLQGNPEYLVFERESVNVIYSNPRLNIRPYNKNDVDSAALLKLTNEIRETLDNIKNLEQQAAN